MRAFQPSGNDSGPVPVQDGARAWWEEFFLHQWDAQHGSARTAHVMDRLLAALKHHPRELSFLEGRPLDILDWGCAFGEGSLRLAESFPLGRVTGAEFAENAVRVARRRYPVLTFVREDDDKLPREFDVVFAADRLDHVLDLRETLAGQFAFSRWLHVAFVPVGVSLPEVLNGFTLLFDEPVAFDPAFRLPTRRLVSYASPAYMTLHGLAVPEASTAATRQAPQPASDSADSRLARALAESVARLAEREAYWSARLEEARHDQDLLSTEHARREAAQAAHESALVARLDERGRLIDGLTRHINALTRQHEQDRVALEQAVAELEASLAASQEQVAELARASEKLAAELAELTSGRAWRLARLASAAKRKLASRATLPLPDRHDRRAG